MIYMNTTLITKMRLKRRKRERSQNCMYPTIKASFLLLLEATQIKAVKN